MVLIVVVHAVVIQNLIVARDGISEDSEVATQNSEQRATGNLDLRGSLTKSLGNVEVRTGSHPDSCSGALLGTQQPTDYQKSVQRLRLAVYLYVKDAESQMDWICGA